MDRRKMLVLGMLGGGAVVPAIPWYLGSGDIPLANCIGAYAAKGAADYATSKVNLAHPGTYDATDAAAYPTWDDVNGWKFAHAATQFLDTGIVPAGDQTWSMIIRCTNGVKGPGNYIPWACSSDTNKYFMITGNWAGLGRLYGSGGKSAYAEGELVDGIIAIAGKQGYRDGTADLTVPDGTATITRSILIGKTQSSVQYLTGYIQALAVYNITLTGDQITAIIAGMGSTFGVFKHMVFDGDSLTLGYGASAGKDYPSVLIPNYVNYGKRNYGILSAKVTDMITGDADVTAAYLPGSTLAALGGFNDLYASDTGENIYNNLVIYHAARRAEGYKTIAMTVFASGVLTGGTETQRLDLNTRLRADHSFADGFVDLANDARLQNPADTTYFNVDTTHLSDAGYAVIAELVKTVMDTLA